MALGAQRLDVMKGLRLTLLSVFIGLLGGAVVTRVLASQLYDVSATDPMTFAGVAIILGVVGLFASMLPAASATRVSPIIALRCD